RAEPGEIPRSRCSRKRWLRPWGPTSALVLVDRGERRAGEGAPEHVEPEERGGGVLTDVQRLHVEGVHGEDVTVRAVSRRRGGTDVLCVAAVALEGLGAFRQSGTGGVTGARGQLRHRCGDVEHGPV